jgi:ribosome-binding factor A
MAKKPAASGPSQRMLRVAEEVRHALSAVLSRGDVHDPDLAGSHITVTEVRASPDLRHMTCFVSALGRPVAEAELKGLARVQPYLRTQVARAVRLKFAPQLHFQQDTALDYAMRIDAVMRRPEVAQDLEPKPVPVVVPKPKGDAAGQDDEA